MTEYKHLTIDEENGRAYLLGYDMLLAPIEFTVLCAIASGEDTSGYHALSVHVYAINRRAESIGGRKLLLSCEQGYCLNEFM